MSSFELVRPDFYLSFSLFSSLSPLVCLISLVSHGDKEEGLWLKIKLQHLAVYMLLGWPIFPEALCLAFRLAAAASALYNNQTTWRKKLPWLFSNLCWASIETLPRAHYGENRWKIELEIHTSYHSSELIACKPVLTGHFKETECIAQEKQKKCANELIGKIAGTPEMSTILNLFIYKKINKKDMHIFLPTKL